MPYYQVSRKNRIITFSKSQQELSLYILCKKFYVNVN